MIFLTKKIHRIKSLACIAVLTMPFLFSGCKTEEPPEEDIVIWGKINPNNYKGVFVPGRRVVLDRFYISEYEVTQDEYREVVEGQSVTVGQKVYALNGSPSYCTSTNSSYSVDFGIDQGKRPVESVTWYDAVYYCNLRSTKEGLKPAYSITVFEVNSDGNITSAQVNLVEGSNGYRLPTEAEWEFAARGGDTSAKAWDYTFSGAQITDTGHKENRNPSLDSVGWYCYNNKTGASGTSDVTTSASGRGTHQVGQLTPNAMGLYDMSGNVWEWCWDWYYDTVDGGNVVNPTGPESGRERILRGGSWYNEAKSSSVTYRHSELPSKCYNNVGFRVVRAIGNEEF